MSKNSKLILLATFFICLFISAFFTISYFANLVIIVSNQMLQLFIGVALAACSLIIAILLIVIPIKNRNKINKDEIKKENIELMKINEEKINENVTTSSQNNEIIMKDVVNATSDIINEANKAKQTILEIDGINQEDQTSEEIFYELENQIEENSDDAFVLQQMNDDENEKNSFEEMISLYNPQTSLSDTQINFINASDNSHFDENGRPQLNVTQELKDEYLKSTDINDEDIKTANLQFAMPKQKEILNQEKIDDEYQLFKYDKYNSIITTIIIILLITSIISLGYLFLSVFVF